MKLKIAVSVVVLLLAALGAWGSFKLYHSVIEPEEAGVPTAPVRRGDVSFSVSAKGELQGGNTEMLFAPMTGGGAMTLTELRESGELVKEGEVVAQFDTTEQEFKLKEALADLAEAEQQVTQANAESVAKAEEARYALLQAQSEVEVAGLECRRNELLSKIAARQNQLALGAAQDKVKQLERDIANRLETAKAGIAIQEAAKSKATVAAETARRNIESMTLRAKTGGYVARQQAMDGNFRWGSYIPTLQVGDNVRAGMAVAQIPDMTNWEATARIAEVDRGHLAVGQPVELRVIALPGKSFVGKIKSIGGTTGPPWDRQFDTRVALEKPSPELRPGMSVRMVITTDVMKSVLWLPAQAVFDSEGRKFVYIQSGPSFMPKDIKMVRRSESKVVVEGLPQGQLVALASPDQAKSKQPAQKGGAMQAIPK
jgi:multidrug efflux pump subunit AcrA (membrane-fusion protein)